MTRESLAKDILIAFIPRWTEIVEGVPPTVNTLKAISANCVELADALLGALGTTEPPASWLSKEMRTPAKGFPALKEDSRWIPKVGDKVRVKDGLPLPRGLYSGQVGKVASVYGGEIQVAFERSWLHFMEDDLDPADLEPVE